MVIIEIKTRLKSVWVNPRQIEIPLIPLSEMQKTMIYLRLPLYVL